MIQPDTVIDFIVKTKKQEPYVLVFLFFCFLVFLFSCFYGLCFLFSSFLFSLAVSALAPPRSHRPCWLILEQLFPFHIVPVLLLFALLFRQPQHRRRDDSTIHRGPVTVHPPQQETRELAVAVAVLSRAAVEVTRVDSARVHAHLVVYIIPPVGQAL